MNNHQAMQDAFDELKKRIDILLEERDFLRQRVETLEKAETLFRIGVVDDYMKDVTSASVLDIVIKADGKVVWINTEKGCQFRACRIGHLTVHDERSPQQRGEQERP